MVKRSKPAAKSSKPPALVETSYESDEESSFSRWLHSSDGIEHMKLFVLMNSLFVLALMSWPKIKQCFDIVYYMYLDIFK